MSFCFLTRTLRAISYPSLISLYIQGAKRVQQVEALQGEKGALLAAETMGSDETSLCDALWCCANLYRDCKLRLGHKRLLMFTCRDQPHGGDSVKDRQARTQASDLRETGGSQVANACCAIERHHYFNELLLHVNNNKCL